MGDGRKMADGYEVGSKIAGAGEKYVDLRLFVHVREGETRGVSTIRLHSSAEIERLVEMLRSASKNAFPAKDAKP